jgi:alpha-amylase/alpha-mannosidase (GH57 family)
MEKKIDIAFLWHMHQPFYKDDLTGKYLMPWVRMHGVKDYYPMAAILERYPKVKATFNIVPVLMEQLNDYVHNNATDTLLDLTVKKAGSLTFEDKVQILEHFFRVNFKNFIGPNPRYSELLLKKGLKPLSDDTLEKAVKTFSDQDMLDLQVLYNMTWFHSINIDEDPTLKDLAAKQSYTESDKIYVVSKQREILSRILPLYKRMQDRGQIEISTTPYYHPILPLLCDTSVARMSTPAMELPKRRFAYPEDARWHLENAIKYYTEQFGRPPRGMWPSEGSVSDEALEIMMSLGIKWVATDEDILFKSLALEDKAAHKGHHRGGMLDRRLIYQPYSLRRAGESITMIFRDKNLSDIISFNYNAWDQKDAAMDLMAHFRKIAEHMRKDASTGLATIAMDGENAWEYFEDNGRTFFETLYSELSKTEDMPTATVSGYIEKAPPKKAISSVFPASWINHNFEIWIGQEQDNESWEYLHRTRDDLVRFTKDMPKKDRDAQRAWREFYISEGSDWNWWYSGKINTGDHNPFDRLYRMHLKNVYKALKKPVPDFLDKAISQ